MPWPPVRRSADLTLAPLRERILSAVRDRPGIRLGELTSMLRLQEDADEGGPIRRRDVAYHVERLDERGDLLRGRFRWRRSRWLFPEEATWLWENDRVRWLFRSEEARRLALAVASADDPPSLVQVVRRSPAGRLRLRVDLLRLQRRGLVDAPILGDGRLEATKLLERVGDVLDWRRGASVADTGHGDGARTEQFPR